MARNHKENTLDRINAELDRLDDKIYEYETQIVSLLIAGNGEDHPALKECRKLKDERNKEKNELKAQREKLLNAEKKTLYEHLRTSPSLLIPAKRVDGSKSFTKVPNMTPPVLRKWSTFEQQFKPLLDAKGLIFASNVPDHPIKSDVFITSLDGESIKHYICELKRKLPQEVLVATDETPQSGNKDAKKVYVDLVDSYLKPDEVFERDNLYSYRVSASTAVAKQVFFYSEKLKTEATDEYRLYYTMLSTVQVTYLFFHDKHNILNVSPPIERDDFFFASYFILLLRYPSLIPNGAMNLRQHIENVHLDLNSLGPELPDNYPKMKESDGEKENDGPAFNTRSNVNGKTLTISPSELYEYYMYNSEMVFANENIFLAKFQHQGKCCAMKCCDIFNSPQDANDELKNEARVFSQLFGGLKEKNTATFDFLPKFLYYGVISILRMIVTEFVDGTCYSYFDEMSLDEKRACELSLQKFHRLGVLHGDVRAPNFIIKNAKTSNPTAVIIDLGRSRFSKDKNLFANEMRLFFNDSSLPNKVLNDSGDSGVGLDDWSKTNNLV